MQRIETFSVVINDACYIFLIPTYQNENFIVILGIPGWLTSDVLVRKAAEKINNCYAIITRPIEKNASIADTRNVYYVQECRKDGSLVGIIQEYKISDDRFPSKENTEKNDGYKVKNS